MSHLLIKRRGNEVLVSGFHAMSKWMLETLSPFSHQVKDTCRRKDGQKCATTLLQVINHELGQFSVTSSRSSSTLIIHEERLEYGFLRAKRVLFIAVLSGPSMPSSCSLVLLHSVVQSFQQTQSASVCSVLPRTGKRRQIRHAGPLLSTGLKTD